MEQNFIAELKELLQKLPGIGPRQASRFIWTMLDFTPEEQQKLSRAVAELPQHIRRCTECFRVFTVSTQNPADNPPATCSFCKPTSKRNRAHIMVVEKDNDVLAVEKTGLYEGRYHVLGATLDPLGSPDTVRERINALSARLSTKDLERPREVILALSPSKAGEFTSEYIQKIISPLKIKVTRLGRGLATGTELEYADEYTIRQAFDNRK